MSKKVVCLGAFLFLFMTVSTVMAEEKRFSVMGLGDSITEGGKDFDSYLYDLWELLYAGGYNADFVGPNERETRIGMLRHCGFSGKPVEFLEERIDSFYSKNRADIVLLHAGHNHFAEQKPVEGMIEAYRSIVRKIWSHNPKAYILIAQVTPSGKLPKYEYIPELNQRIKQLVEETANKRLMLVDMATGHEWQTMTIHDKVHPNDQGARRMAERWFAAIKKIEKPHRKVQKPEVIGYKTASSGRELNLHLFRTKKKNTKKPTLVYFFAGGWKYGSPLQFYRECMWYSKKGYNAVSVDYSIKKLDSSTPLEARQDAIDAIKNIKKSDFAKNGIIIAGASAGGAIAGQVADGLVEGRMLYYPVVDSLCADIMHKPTLLLIGTKDSFTPIDKADDFARKLKQQGTPLTYKTYQGSGHPLFRYRDPLTPIFYDIRRETYKWLRKFCQNHTI